MENMPTFFISLLFLVFLQCSNIVEAQPAIDPSPAGPANITAILEKAGQFTTLIRLLKSTQADNQINQQLNSSNGGLTVFAPTDSAFTQLSSGTLNSLTDQQQVELVQYHVISSLIPPSQFQTVSNPLRTQAGNANDGQFQLNVTTKGNQVNLTTGVVNTPISNTIYWNDRLAVYQVDQVLLPMALFGTPAPAEAPATATTLAPSPSKPDKVNGPPDSPTGSSKDSEDTSIAITLYQKSFWGFVITTAANLLWFTL